MASNAGALRNPVFHIKLKALVAAAAPRFRMKSSMTSSAPRMESNLIGCHLPWGVAVILLSLLGCLNFLVIASMVPRFLL